MALHRPNPSCFSKSSVPLQVWGCLQRSYVSASLLLGFLFQEKQGGKTAWWGGSILLMQSQAMGTRAPCTRCLAQPAQLFVIYPTAAASGLHPSFIAPVALDTLQSYSEAEQGLTLSPSCHSP